MLWYVSVLKCLSALTKFLKRHYVIEKETCMDRSLFIYSVFVYLAWDIRTCVLLIWNPMKGFNLPMLNATETIKNWSKRKLFEVSKFLLSSIGQNRKFGNLGNGHCFLLKPHCKVKVFSYKSFFQFWVSYTTKNLSKIKLSKISEISILGIGQNRKLGNLGKWYFFLLNHITTL